MEEQMYLLMAKALNGEIEQEEQEELDQWLEQDPQNKNTYRDLEKLWNDTDSVWEQPGFDTAAAWDKVAALTTNLHGEGENPAPKTMPFRKWLQLSGAAAAVLILVFFVYNFTKNDMVTVTSGDKGLVLDLPDGSKVRLQAHSTLKYAKNFEGTERSLSLEGAAFFDVARDEQKPFIIDAAATEVSVLGTSFYVTASTGLTTVAVTTGKVGMTPRKTKEQVVLTPGQKGIYRGTNIQVVTDTNFVYYTQGVLQFKGTPLSRVLEVIATVRNVPVAPASSLPEAARQQLVEISFPEQTLEQMLDELCLITNTRWQKVNDQYLIYSK